MRERNKGERKAENGTRAEEEETQIEREGGGETERIRGRLDERRR